ncbi:MAG: TolC family protein [Nitrospirae bacterium]|nr:TolC family protein [Nitrospirota bacterium]
MIKRKTGLFFVLFLVFFPPYNLFAEEYSLDDLYRIALERAERIKLSEEDLYIAERGKDKAVSALLPKLSAFGNYTKYSEDKRSSTGSVIQPDDSTSWGLRLDQSLSISGRELTAFKISKGNIEKNRYDLYAVREAYLFNVASAYYDVLRAKKAVDIAKANVERLTKHRDAAAIRLKVGEVTKTALLRAEAELSGAQSELIRAENNLKLAKAILARVVGIEGEYDVRESLQSSVGSPQSFDFSFLTADCRLSTGDCFKQTAFKERAEVRSGEIQKRIAEDQVRYTKGAYWPTLSIEGVYSRKDEEPASAFLNKESIYGGLRLNFPFFEGGLRKAEVREAEAKQRQSELLYEDLKKTISIEVDNAYLDLTTQKGILKSLEDQLAFARDNYNAISKQFEFGLANSIDVMDANTLLVTAERQFSDAMYNYQLSILRLQRTTGTLLKTVISQQSPVARDLKEK